MGCQIQSKNDIIQISRENLLISPGKIITGYYPRFPTDLQSCVLALLCVSKGKSFVRENIFENRFLNVSELTKMGAKIEVKNSHNATIEGVDELTGTTVEAKDLRGGASLVLAGLVASGKTIVQNIEFVDRGYEKLEEILSSLGADIKRI